MQDAARSADIPQRMCESKLRTPADDVPGLIWICTPIGENIFINRRWSEFTGQSEADAAGFGWMRAIHPEDWRRIAPYWERCRQTGEVYEGECRYRHHDGQYRWHLVRALPRRNSDDAIEAWDGLSLDIHELKQDEEILEKLSGSLIEPGDGEALHEQILDAAIAITRADFGSIQVLDERRGELNLLACRNFHPDSARSESCRVHWKSGKRH